MKRKLIPEFFKKYHFLEITPSLNSLNSGISEISLTFFSSCLFEIRGVIVPSPPSPFDFSFSHNNNLGPTLRCPNLSLSGGWLKEIIIPLNLVLNPSHRHAVSLLLRTNACYSKGLALTRPFRLLEQTNNGEASRCFVFEMFIPQAPWHLTRHDYEVRTIEAAPWLES